MHRPLFFCQKRACEHSVGADLSALSKSWRMAARQQSLLHVMQLMQLMQQLQIPLVKSSHISWSLQINPATRRC